MARGGRYERGKNLRNHDQSQRHGKVSAYNRLLGLKVLDGGENAYFSSLQTLGAKDTILNLEKGHVTPDWGRIIFYVEDVDRFWAHLKEKEFGPARPRDAAWGERFFYLHDPDGHELSFAQPIR